MLTSPRAALALAALTLTATSLAALPAHADPCDGNPGGIGCGIEGENNGNGGDGNNGNGGGGGGNGGENANPDDDGAGDFEEVENDPEAEHVPTQPVADQAIKNVPFPVPKIFTAPPLKSFVRIKTAFWIPPGIDEKPQVKAKATVGGAGTGIAFQEVTATAKVSKIEFFWSEDGEEDLRLTCLGKGRVKGVGAQPPCEYVFKYASAHEGGEVTKVRAVLHWVVTWVCRGDCDQAAGGNPDVAADPPAVLLLPIDEIQAESN